MALWKDDDALFGIAKQELFPALVGDVLDKLGLLQQFLPPSIKPLDSKMVVIGRAMPVLEADVHGEKIEEGSNALLRKPFGLMFEALDSLQGNEIYVCSGASPRYALWGGLMTTRASRLGAAGAVVNGYTRDTNEVLRFNFPIFGMGTYAQDQGPRGKVLDYRIPILFDHTIIKPGDIIYGDLDGVIVIPQEVEKEAFSKAIEKCRGEQRVKEALEKGMSSKEAFETFGIM